MLNTYELTRAEKNRGLVKPFRQQFRHVYCQRTMKWSTDEALGHARRLKPRRMQWCSHCKKYDLVANFEFIRRSSIDGAILCDSMRVWEFSVGIM